MPNTITPCPSAIDLSHPESLVSRCHVSCSKSSTHTANQQKAAGIPVSPLPGEAGQLLQAPVIPFSQAAQQAQELSALSDGAGMAIPQPAALASPPSVPGTGSGVGSMNASPKLNGQGLPIVVNAKVSSGQYTVNRRDLSCWGGLYYFSILAVAISAGISCPVLL